MTKDEFLERQQQMNNDIQELLYQRTVKEAELVELRNEWCLDLCNQYKKYMRKHVKVVFEHKIANSVRRLECEGFLWGFSVGQHHKDIIYPEIAKIKNNGTPSKRFFVDWELFRWDEIVSIEEV